MKEMQTDRLTLKVLDEGHAAEVLDFVVRNRVFLQEWESRRDEQYYTIEFQRNQLMDEWKKIQEGSLFKIWIYKKEKCIGSIALNNIVRGCFQSCHLGYKMDKDEQNRGYMKEALRPVIKFGFQTLHLHRIEANIMPRNKASLKVVESLGFQNEGLAQKYLKINGRWEDHVHMVLLNHELDRCDE